MRLVEGFSSATLPVARAEAHEQPCPREEAENTAEQPGEGAAVHLPPHDVGFRGGGKLTDVYHGPRMSTWE
jgi:hypothetical protein